MPQYHVSNYIKISQSQISSKYLFHQNISNSNINTNTNQADVFYMLDLCTFVSLPECSY